MTHAPRSLALLGACACLAFCAGPARAFEWDDGRGATPFKLHTSRYYISADQREALDWPQQRYGRRLATAIGAQTPPLGGLGSGRATLVFLIGADGRPGAAQIASASSPAHSAAALRAIQSLRAPPPPGGAFHARQNFAFH
jgi:hypothetical protein